MANTYYKNVYVKYRDESKREEGSNMKSLEMCSKQKAHMEKKKSHRSKGFPNPKTLGSAWIITHIKKALIEGGFSDKG